MLSRSPDHGTNMMMMMMMMTTTTTTMTMTMTMAMMMTTMMMMMISLTRIHYTRLQQHGMPQVKEFINKCLFSREKVIRRNLFP